MVTLLGQFRANSLHPRNDVYNVGYNMRSSKNNIVASVLSQPSQMLSQLFARFANCSLSYDTWMDLELPSPSVGHKIFFPCFSLA